MEFPYRNPRYGDPEKVLHYSSVTHKLAFLKFLDHKEKYLGQFEKLSILMMKWNKIRLLLQFFFDQASSVYTFQWLNVSNVKTLKSLLKFDLENLSFKKGEWLILTAV